MADTLTVPEGFADKTPEYRCGYMDGWKAREAQQREPAEAGRVIIIRNENGTAIGALSGEPRTGVERVLDALYQWQCPDHPHCSCITLDEKPASVLLVVPVAAKEAARAAIEAALRARGKSSEADDCGVE